MEKKQRTLVVVSLLVVVLSVSVAYFTAQIIGQGKDISVTSANLQVIFTDTDGEITATDIEPGWTSTKSFTVKNSTKTEYKYNIVLKDLVNTFITTGYLQYKITSTNNGYNMTDFEDIPKSVTATDEILAYSVSIPTGVTQSYTIEFKYTNDENANQSEDMGKTLSGTLFITEGSYKTITYADGTLGKQLLSDKTTRPGERKDFSTTLTTDNTKTLYTGNEDNTTVYYFAGNATDNWVKFGKNSSEEDLYWRIIRTNADGGIRLLYHGTSTTAEDAYINNSTTFNNSYTNLKYVGYMYDSNGTNSTIKNTIDSWYESNLKLYYGKYLSTTAVYCNDRTSDGTNFGARIRLYTNKTPTYDCANTEDKFTVSSITGNGKLTYPIALMTADEISFAGGLWANDAPAYYFKNSVGVSSTGSTYWYTMSPYGWIGSASGVFRVSGSDHSGRLLNVWVNYTNGVARPAISLKSCTQYGTGDGSADNPYTIDESGC